MIVRFMKPVHARSNVFMGVGLFLLLLYLFAIVFSILWTMQKIVVVGANFSACIVSQALFEKGYHPCLLVPAIPRETLYHISPEKSYALEGHVFSGLDCKIYSAPPTAEELHLLSTALGVSKSIVEKESDSLFAKLKTKSCAEDVWADFSQDLRHHDFSFSDLYALKWGEKDFSSTKKTYQHSIRWKRIGEWIAIYDGIFPLFITKKLFLCDPEPLQVDEVVIGQWIHHEKFMERGFHYCSGWMGSHSISILHEEENVWIRGQGPVLIADSQMGLTEWNPFFQDAHQVLDYFESAEEGVELYPDFFQLQNPRPIHVDEGVYCLHPWHLPSTHQIWLMIKIASQSLIKAHADN